MRQVFYGWGVASKRKVNTTGIRLTIYYPHPLLQMSTSHVWSELDIYVSNEQGVSENMNLEWGARTPGQI